MQFQGRTIRCKGGIGTECQIANNTLTIMPDNKGKEQKQKAKKAWSKPKLVSGKEIGFFGLGQIQSTGPGGDPSGS